MPRRLDRDISRLQLIVELVEHIRRRLAGWDHARFNADRDEVDLTAYRLSIIGETCNKLSAELKAAHPGLPWRDIYGMRNVIVHDYPGIDTAKVWEAVQLPLTELALVCRREFEERAGIPLDEDSQPVGPLPGPDSPGL